MTASSIERELQLMYVGGPTVVLEIAGLRLVTDPTFDPAGGDYRTKLYVLRKTQGPAVRPEAIGPVDVVLLTHDHHADNLDLLGRASLSKAKRVITTPAGAERLQGWATRLTPWDSIEIPCADAAWSGRWRSRSGHRIRACTQRLAFARDLHLGRHGLVRRGGRSRAAIRCARGISLHGSGARFRSRSGSFDDDRRRGRRGDTSIL
jgi:hypothetical protein